MACPTLKGHNTGGAESPPNHLPTALPLKRLAIFCFLYWLTRKRVNQFFYTHLFICYIFLHLIPYVLCYCLFLLSLLYLHNIHDTNTLCFRFGISCLHVGQISSGYFFLLSIPWNLIHLFGVVSTPINVYDLGWLLLLLFLRLSTDTVFFLFVLCLVWSSPISLVYDT